MTYAEYINISPIERNNGHKNLLQAHLSIIKSIEHLNNYKKLRKKEHLLRINLRSSVSDALSLLKTLQKQLPKTEHESPEVIKKNQSLLRELNIIKQKLENLQ